jgi:2,3-dihydroxyphenylpropionate 1,2-dioxygenase
MYHNRANRDVEKIWNDALERAIHFVAESKPELCIVFYPDHLNGFLYDLMPAFCIGAGGTSIGDFGTAPGSLSIPEALAASCAAHCISDGIDVAISYNMVVDHGGVQPLEMLSIYPNVPAVIPIFVNCAAPPRPTFERVRALGTAVGKWAARCDKRVMLIGSGGLSHDPPLPSISSGTTAAQRRLREGGALSHPERQLRQQRVQNEGQLFSRGISELRPLNPEWDEQIMLALAGGDLRIFDNLGDSRISSEGGSGAHELRCWVAALSAVGVEGAYSIHDSFYTPINEWITGMGILTASPTFRSVKQ